ncbi:hypothetical protein K502DRAFT_292458 [Neoconidiobolus thromboides FSU 785]|nr:hypothetical protein K502DRAFT_292458 [Neoconidiobolus thromboides FSU 785]
MDLSSKLNQLIIIDGSNELEGQSQPIIPILQSSLRNQTQNEILEKLNDLLNKKELEIEKLCYSHYQEFIQSVDQLLEVKKGTSTLKENILEVNESLQQSGNKLLATKSELIQHRRIQQNIETCIETLQTCLHILKLANRVNTLLNQRNYFSALKTLDELQNEHLPHINQYLFAKYMEECIPSMRDLVKQAVILEKRDWLLQLKEQSRNYGLSKIQKMLDKQQSWIVRQKKENSNYPAAIHLVKDELEIDEEENIMELDFQPFYQCLHIHHKLGSFEEFQKSFEEERRQMAINLSETNLILGKKSLDLFQIHLADILGFFQIERTIINTTTRFRYPTDVEILWTLLTNKLLDEISRGLGIASMENTLPDIKKNLVAFIQLGEVIEVY